MKTSISCAGVVAAAAARLMFAMRSAACRRVTSVASYSMPPGKWK
jgi:hypothetical protein